jgi:hypothetical protein
MNRLQTTARKSPRLAVLLALLAACAAFGALAQPAFGVAVLNTDVAEEMANEYAEEFCSASQDCMYASASRCQQHGKFIVPCLETAYYESETELWKCTQRIRISVDKKLWYGQKKWRSKLEKLAPWHCEAHHRIKDW